MKKEVVEKKENLPAEIKSQVDSSGIELSKAEKIASNYVPFMAQAQDISNKLKGLDFENPEDVAIAKRARLDLGSVCSSVVKQKATDKNLILIETRFIDGLFNTVNGFARLTQKDAESIEKKSENIEKERIEKLNLKRIELVSPFIEDVEGLFLADMDEDVWDAYLSTKKKNFNDKIEAEKKAEELRIETERKEQEERERIAKENAKLKAEANAREKQIEKERLEREKLAKIESERIAKIEAERITKDNEAKKIQAEKERKQKEAHENELRIERERIAKIESETKRLNDERIAKEKAKAEAEKAKIEAELNKGDAEKVKDLIKDFQELKGKYTFKSAKNKKMYSDVGGLIDKTTNFINK